MSKEEKTVKKTITEKNIRGKVQVIKIQISEQGNMSQLLQAKLNETNNNIIVLKGKMVAYVELLQELTGATPRGTRRPAPRLPTQPPTVPKKKPSSKKKGKKEKK